MRHDLGSAADGTPQRMRSAVAYRPKEATENGEVEGGIRKAGVLTFVTGMARWKARGSRTR